MYHILVSRLVQRMAVTVRSNLQNLETVLWRLLPSELVTTGLVIGASSVKLCPVIMVSR